MRIALGQLKINWENKDANLEKLKVCLEDLAGTRIDLLLLPEMSLTGFSMNTEKTKEREKDILRKNAGTAIVPRGVLCSFIASYRR